VHFVWYNPSGVKIQSNKSIHNANSTVFGQVQSVLSLYSVNHTDSGEYLCVAFNHIKSSSELKTKLTVECKL